MSKPEKQILVFVSTKKTSRLSQKGKANFQNFAQPRFFLSLLCKSPFFLLQSEKNFFMQKLNEILSSIDLSLIHI